MTPRELEALLRGSPLPGPHCQGEIKIKKIDYKLEKFDGECTPDKCPVEIHEGTIELEDE